MLEPIQSFSGPHRFLSNFWRVDVEFEGVMYPSVEHAYVAAKSFDKTFRQKVRQASTPGKAKQLGRQVSLRDDWEQVKLGVMEELLVRKFRKPALRDRLLATKPRDLIEGNHWGDRIWGQCDGTGKNYLGRLLMKIRFDLEKDHGHQGNSDIPFRASEPWEL